MKPLHMPTETVLCNAHASSCAVGLIWPNSFVLCVQYYIYNIYVCVARDSIRPSVAHLEILGTRTTGAHILFLSKCISLAENDCTLRELLCYYQFNCRKSTMKFSWKPNGM